MREAYALTEAKSHASVSLVDANSVNLVTYGSFGYAVANTRTNSSPNTKQWQSTQESRGNEIPDDKEKTIHELTRNNSNQI